MKLTQLVIDEPLLNRPIFTKILFLHNTQTNIDFSYDQHSKSAVERSGINVPFAAFQTFSNIGFQFQGFAFSDNPVRHWNPHAQKKPLHRFLLIQRL
jgi:hypothetical protein